MAIRQVNALTVLLDWPLSLTKKIKPLASEPTITNMTPIIMIFVNICYTLYFDARMGSLFYGYL